MPKLDIINQTGKKIGDIELSDYVFGINPHKQALFDVVNAQRAAMRQGNAAVKTRAEVSGGGKKPWKQKGTGRARHGSIRSPQWRGGGIVFGPTPRSYSVKINKKVRNLALRSSLSHHYLNESLIILDNLTIENGKTKEFKAILDNLNINEKVLFVIDEINGNEIRAGKNLPKVEISLANHISVYDVLNVKKLILTQNAARTIEKTIGANKDGQIIWFNKRTDYNWKKFKINRKK